MSAHVADRYRHSRRRDACLMLVAAVLIITALWYLERGRAGIELSTLTIDATPATLYRQADADGPMVIVAHGFAGSRQLMQAFSLTLARAGYRVLAFDFEGHGRHPIPMSGDVTAIDGTTRLLVEETRRVIDAARRLTGPDAGMALLGHSMATDVLVRAAVAERREGRPVDAVVGISLFSEAVTRDVPVRLLIINGEWEARLRTPARAALRQIDPTAEEGDTVSSGGVTRRAVVAPHVEHVGVLYSRTSLQATRDWLDATFARNSTTALVQPGPWILLLLFGIVLAFRPLASLLANRQDIEPGRDIATPRFLLAILLPAVLVPMLALLPPITFLPVLVADYLMIHLLCFGVLQLILLRSRERSPLRLSLPAAGLLVVWGIGVFGLALDRYAASFLPSGGRLTIVAVLCIGTLPFMVADSIVSGAGEGRWWRRIAARLALVASLVAAALLDTERLIFLLLIVPLLLLFYLVHGLMGRWCAQRAGPLTAGVGLGVCLAWALGVSFPLFDAP